MPALDISKSPNLLDGENRLSTTFLTNFLLRPNPQSQDGYLLESMPGLKRLVNSMGLVVALHTTILKIQLTE